MTRESETREWLCAAAAGDARVVARLSALAHEQLVTSGFRTGELTLTRKAVLRALLDYQNGEIADTELQRWAWFVMRGYVPGVGDGPVLPLQIDYEHGFEEVIAAVVGRCSELGDLVDGTIDPQELAALVGRLATLGDGAP